MLHKKSQEFLDFILKYGWVLIILIILVLSFAIVGLINPDLLIKEKSNFNLSIKSAIVSNNVVTLIVQNYGDNVTNYRINVTECPGKKLVRSGPINLSANSVVKVTVLCGNVSTTSKKKKIMIGTPD